MILLRSAILSLRMLLRNRMRASLAVAGIAVAVFILCAERAVQGGVREATTINERDTRLVVYRANRFCPFTSHLPERYAGEVASMPGVKSAVPMQIVVSNCQASLDVVVFRGVPAADAERSLAPRLRFVEGSLADFLARDDAALVGSGLAARRGLRTGDRLQSAGITVTIAGIVDAEGPQDRNSCLVHLPFLQAASGGTQGGTVTQLEVEVDDPSKLREVASAIDAYFATDRAPTTTRPEKTFVARAAADLVAIADFAGLLGIGALLAIFALVANAIVLSLGNSPCCNRSASQARHSHGASSSKARRSHSSAARSGPGPRRSCLRSASSASAPRAFSSSSVHRRPSRSPPSRSHSSSASQQASFPRSRRRGARSSKD